MLRTEAAGAGWSLRLHFARGLFIKPIYALCSAERIKPYRRGQGRRAAAPCPPRRTLPPPLWWAGKPALSSRPGAAGSPAGAWEPDGTSNQGVG